MRTISLLLALAIAGTNPGFCQPKDSVFCKKLTGVFDLMKIWKSSTPISFPLGNKRETRKLQHELLDCGNCVYYSCAANFTNEIVSEFALNKSTGKVSYEAYLGPYSVDSVAIEGARLKSKFLSCTSRGEWDIMESDRVYLYMSYNYVDIVVTLSKRARKNTDQYWLVISMFRFTSFQD